MASSFIKKTKEKLNLIIGVDTLLMVLEQVLEEEYVTLFINMQKLATYTSKIMIKIKNHHILNIGI